MALFKLMKGSASRLPSDKTNGYIWVTYDENNVLQMYIDYEDDNKDIQRGILSAEFANKLRYTADGTMVEIQPEDIIGYNNTTNIPYTVRHGANNDATIKCFLINSYTQTTVTLDSVEGIEVGMRWNIFYQKEDGTYKNRGKILAVDANTNTVTISDGQVGVNNEPGITEDFELSQNPTIRGTFIVNGGMVGVHTIEDDSIKSYGAILNGSSNFATFKGSVEGSGNKVIGFNSHAEGKGTIAKGEYAHVEGYNSQANGHVSHAENFDTRANGAYTHAEGAETQANGDFSHAEGRLTKSNGQSSHAEGESTEATAFAAHAEGNKSVASNSYAHAEGYDNKATGRGAHAEGEGNTASGTGAHAEGRANTVSGYSAHVEGQANTSSAARSHAEGYSTKATADDSHAEGNFSEANGINSHAEGQTARANGQASHAQGRGTYADGIYQHAAGKYNIRDNENKYAEIIGIGSDANNRANGRTLDWQGNAWYAGEVRVGKDNKKLVDETDLSEATNEIKNEIGATSYFAKEASANRPKQDLEFKSVTIQLNNGKPEIVMEFNAAAHFNSSVTNAFIRTSKVGGALQLIQNKVIYEDGFTYEGKDFATRIRMTFNASGGAASTYTDLAELYDSGLVFFNIIEYNGGFIATDGYMSAEQIVDIYDNLMPRNHTAAAGGHPVRYTQFFEDVTDRAQLAGATSHTIAYDVEEVAFADKDYVDAQIINSVADLNQNDENAPDYVKNRTHYEGVEIQIKSQTIIDNLDEFGYHSVYGKWAWLSSTKNFVKDGRSNYAIEGEPATVFTIQGYTDVIGDYYPTVQALESASWKQAYCNSEGSSYFGLMWIDKNSSGNEVYTGATRTLHVSYDEQVETPKIYQLDEKFIPDTIARVEDLEDITKNTVGKFSKDDEGNIQGEIFNDYENNQARGIYSHVEGCNNSTILPTAHVEGRLNQIGELYGYDIVEYNNLGNNQVDVQIGLHGDPFIAPTEGLEIGMACAIYNYSSTNTSGWSRVLRGYIVAVDYNHIIIDTISTLNDDKITRDDKSDVFGKLIVNGGVVGSQEVYKLENLGNFFTSHVEGQNNVATFISHAEGYATKAVGLGSHAEGAGTEAIGERSHAEGYCTKAIGFETHAEGLNTIASGYGSHAEGTSTKAIGEYSHAENNTNEAIGNNSHAEGLNNRAEGQQSHVEGRGCVAIGENSHAEGHQNKAQGAAAHTEGSTNLAGWDNDFINSNIKRTNYPAWHPELPEEFTDFNSDYAHIEGYKNIAGKYSHAEGFSNVAIANKTSGAKIYGGSHAEGKFTRATGEYSHSEGFKTVASGSTSHAEGDQTWAEGNYSHTEGQGTYAKGAYQHVGGKWNIPNSDMLEIIGNGTNNENRSNARTLDKNGNAWYAGEVRVGADKKRLLKEGDITQVQGDWNQNDENAPDYIKNRTHYEAMGVEERGKILWIRDINWEWRISDGMSRNAFMYDASDLPLDNPESHSWEINGKEAAVIDTTSSDGSITLKGLRTVDGTWGMEYLYESGGYSYGIWTTEAGVYEVKISHKAPTEVLVVHPLDEKFIPNTIARTSMIGDINAILDAINGEVI